MIKETAKAAITAWMAANAGTLMLMLLALGFLVVAISQIGSCNATKEKEKIANMKTEKSETSGEVKQIEVQRDEKKSDIKQAENNSALAANVAANVEHTDSSTRNSSRSAARKEWCKDHQTDSKCRER